MKRLKKLCCLLIALIAILSSLSVSTSAATVHLNKTNKTLQAGQSYTLKVVGNKKKVKWTSSNKRVATVSKTGKVKALSKGKAVITAKVSNKSYKCNITVKKAISGKNLSYSAVKCNGYVILTIKNNNDYMVNVDSTMVFYGYDGKMLYTSNDDEYGIAPGDTFILEYVEPYDDDCNDIPYKNYKVSFDVDESSNEVKSYVRKIDTSDTNISSSGIVVHAVNKSNKKINLCEIGIFMYDDNGNVIKYSTSTLDAMSPGGSSYTTFELPDEYDIINDTYKTITPSSYKIYVLSANSIN